MNLTGRTVNVIHGHIHVIARDMNLTGRTVNAIPLTSRL